MERDNEQWEEKRISGLKPGQTVTAGNSVEIEAVEHCGEILVRLKKERIRVNRKQEDENA